MSIRVGIASRGDAPALAAISAQEYDSWTAEQFLSSMDSPVARVWSAYQANEEEKPLGYAVVYYDRDGSELVQIAVDRHARRQGVGTALLHEIAAFLREEGVPQIILEVRAHNAEAIAFYAQRGFRRLLTQKDYYRHPTDDALRMMRSING